MLTASTLFSRTDNGSGGWLQTTKRRVKFGWRFWRHGNHVRSIHLLLEQHGLGSLAESDPTLLMRSLRSYLWTGLDAHGRARAMHEHLTWLATQHPREAVLHLYRRGEVDVAVLERDVHRISFCLQPGRALGREGELELQLKLDGQMVMQAAFSVLPHGMVGQAASGKVMVIGNMQGSQLGPEPVKLITQMAERVRPRNLLMTALQGLAHGWQLSGMLGVADVAHPYAGYRRTLSRRVSANYDALWQDLGATRKASESHWELPLALALRPEEEVPSRKRAEYRRRNLLRQQIFDSCAAAATSRLTGTDDPQRIAA